MNSNIQERRSLIDLLIGTKARRLALSLGVVVVAVVMVSASFGPTG